ncbi:MAG TPA: hypothetical protein VE225_00490 [Rubrobacteraceae bacterium]|nr:hypothetical protein [Rubrobacteraceae bacterium]
MEASVSEIHDYPLRPDGFEEPLFPGAGSKRAVAEHLLQAPWLSRASEMEGRSGQAVHVRRESVEIENHGGSVRVSWASGKRRCRKERRVVEVLDRWREIRAWWDEDAAVDRTLVRVLLSNGAVVDLAREGSGWFLVGVAD